MYVHTQNTHSLFHGCSCAVGTKDEDGIVRVVDSLVEEDVESDELSITVCSLHPVPLVVLHTHTRTHTHTTYTHHRDR